MTTSYLPYDPQQQFLLPHALQDWLPEGHLAYFISDTVDSLDLSAFHARYAGGGARNQPFHPAMMVKVLVYGYATGVFSSRKLARKLHEDVGGQLSGAPDAVRLPRLSPQRTVGLVRASGETGQGVRPG
jgi:transposase